MRLNQRIEARPEFLENNIYDNYRTDGDSVDTPIGVTAYGYESPAPYIFPQMVVRENLMRTVDGKTSQATINGDFAYGVNLDSVENAIVEENIVDLGNPNQIQHLWSLNVNSLNNTTASGKLLRGHSRTPPEILNQKDDELATLIEDAMVLSL